MSDDIEKVKEYLNQVRESDKLIDLKQKRLDELRQLSIAVRSPDYSGDRVQTSPSGDSIPRIIAKIVDLQEEINADIDRFIDLKAEVMHVVDILPSDEQEVLYAKYFEYKSMPKVAAEIPCHIRTAKHIHKKALEHLASLPLFATMQTTPDNV